MKTFLCYIILLHCLHFSEKGKCRHFAPCTMLCHLSKWLDWIGKQMFLFFWRCEKLDIKPELLHGTWGPTSWIWNSGGVGKKASGIGLLFVMLNVYCLVIGRLKMKLVKGFYPSSLVKDIGNILVYAVANVVASDWSPETFQRQAFILIVNLHGQPIHWDTW